MKKAIAVALVAVIAAASVETLAADTPGDADVNIVEIGAKPAIKESKDARSR